MHREHRQRGTDGQAYQFSSRSVIICLVMRNYTDMMFTGCWSHWLWCCRDISALNRRQRGAASVLEYLWLSLPPAIASRLFQRKGTGDVMFASNQCRASQRKFRFFTVPCIRDNLRWAWTTPLCWYGENVASSDNNSLLRAALLNNMGRHCQLSGDDNAVVFPSTTVGVARANWNLQRAKIDCLSLLRNGRLDACSLHVSKRPASR